MSTPPPADFEAGKFDRETFAHRGSKLMGMAAETFNLGLRACYFAFAAILAVVFVLYSREFRSEVLQVLKE